MQFIINGILASASFVLAGLACAIIIRGIGFFNLALGAIFTLGGYFVFSLHVKLLLPLWIAVPIAISLCAVLGMLFEAMLFSPLRAKQAGPSVLLLVSIGLYIILYGLIELIYGPQVEMIVAGGPRSSLQILGIRITTIQLVTWAVAIAACVSLSCFLKLTKGGVALRAVATDSELAAMSGIELPRIRMYASAIGCSLAAICGFMIGMDSDLSPNMGMRILFGGLVVAIAGGVDSVFGIVLAAFLLGIAQHVGVWKIGSQWQDTIAFAILLIFLLFRPQGFFGKNFKKAIL